MSSLTDTFLAARAANPDPEPRRDRRRNTARATPIRDQRTEPSPENRAGASFRRLGDRQGFSWEDNASSREMERERPNRTAPYYVRDPSFDMVESFDETDQAAIDATPAERGRIQADVLARRAADRAREEYSPLSEDWGLIDAAAGFLTNVQDRNFDTVAAAAGDEGAQVRLGEREERGRRGRRQIDEDTLSHEGVLEAFDEGEQARRDAGLPEPSLGERVGEFWRGLSGREARAEGVYADAMADFDARESDIRFNAGDPRWAGSARTSRMERNTANEAFGHDEFATNAAALEFVPGLGVADIPVSALRFGGRQTLRLAGREIPEALQAPARLAETQRLGADTLTQEARGIRNTAVTSAGVGAIGGALADDWLEEEGFDDSAAPAIGGALGGLAFARSPRGAQLLDEIGAQTARGAAEGAPVRRARIGEAPAPREIEGEFSVVDEPARTERIEGPEGVIEYEARPDGWHITRIDAVGDDAAALYMRLEQQAREAGTQVLVGRRHAQGSPRLGEAPGARVSEEMTPASRGDSGIPERPDASPSNAGPRGKSPESILATARSWVESFGGGAEGETRAIGVLGKDLERMRREAAASDHPMGPVMVRDLEAMIDAVRSGAYRRGERNTFSARVEEAFPELYATTAPDGSQRIAGLVDREMSPGSQSRLLELSNDGGHIEYTPAGDVWRIHGSVIDEPLRGQGLGVKLYEELIDRAGRAGAREVRSGGHVTPDAQRVWASLERRGYQVTKAQGETGTPVFVVRTRPIERPTASPSTGAQARLGGNAPPDDPGILARGTRGVPPPDDPFEGLNVPPADRTSGRRPGPRSVPPMAQERIAEIEAALAEGRSQREIAAEFGTSVGTVGRIARGEYRAPRGTPNDAGARPAIEAGTEGDFIDALPTNPEQWREIMGRHPWIDSPSKAQLVIMASARDAEGRYLYSTADIANATGYSEGSAAVVLTRARDAGLPIPKRPTGTGGATRRMGGERLHDIIDIMEGAERAGGYVTFPEIGERLGMDGRNAERTFNDALTSGRSVTPELAERIRNIQRLREERRVSEGRGQSEIRRTDLPTRVYHATTDDVQGPLRGQGALGEGAYASTDPDIADWFIRGDDGEYLEGANIVPEMVPSLDRYVTLDRATDDLFDLAMRRGVDADDEGAILNLQSELVERYKREGFVGIQNPEYAGGAGELVTWDARNRRAPWARMSYARRNSSDPFASIVGAAGGTAGAFALANGEAEAQEGANVEEIDGLMIDRAAPLPSARTEVSSFVTGDKVIRQYADGTHFAFRIDRSGAAPDIVPLGQVRGVANSDETADQYRRRMAAMENQDASPYDPGWSDPEMEPVPWFPDDDRWAPEPTTPEWGLIPPLVGGGVGGALGRRVGMRSGRPHVMQGTLGAAGGAAGGAAVAAYSDAEDADFIGYGAALGLGATGLGSLLREGGRQVRQHVGDMPFPRFPTRADPGPTPSNPPRFPGSLEEDDLAREMESGTFPVGFYDPVTGEPLFGGGRRRPAAQPTGEPLPERAPKPPSERDRIIGALTDLDIYRWTGSPAELRRRLTEAIRTSGRSEQEIAEILARHEINPATVMPPRSGEFPPP